MTEFSPAFTYTPDSILEVRSTIEMDQSADRLDRAINEIDSSSDYVLSELEQGVIIQVNVPDALSDVNDRNRYGSIAYSRIISNIDPFLGFGVEDEQDRLFSLDWWGDHGAAGVVYPSFQRWMNTDLLTEELSRDVIDAMTLPYGKKEANRIRKGVRYERYSNGIGAGDGGMSVNVALIDDNFGIIREHPVSEDHRHEEGTVKWRWPNVSTIGNCACWGVSGDDRERVYIRPEAPRLYEMYPHNVDAPIQSLSLAIGMGRLAYEAAQYDGNEDPLEEAVWRG